jgi:hypothetical protein
MRLVRRDDGNPKTENQIDNTAIPKHLEDAMGSHMEQTGGPPELHDGGWSQ